MITRFAYLLAAAMWLAIALIAGEGFAADGEVVLLHTNDAYEIEPDKEGRGGAARLKTVVDRLRGRHKGALLIHSGDFLSPSVMSSAFRGRQMIDAMNAVGFDIVTIGNHEFDFGDAVLKKRIAQSRFAWVASNITQDGAQYPGTIRSVIKTVNGTKVGIFGLILPEAKILSNADSVEIESVIGAAKTVSDELRRAGARIIVAVTHLYLRQDLKLAAAVPSIDVILGGHDHVIVDKRAGKTLVVKSGSDFKTVGVVEITPGASATVTHVPVDGAVAEEAELKKLVEGWTARLGEELNVVVGKTDTALDATTVSNRSGPTNLGGFIAQAMRESVGADVSVINGGGIRSDRIYGPGPVTKKNVYSILPFGGYVVKIRLTGEQLLEALEGGVSKAEGAQGRYPQVAGLTFTADISKPSGSRIAGLKVNGDPLDRQAKYSVATNDYMLGGGDGYFVFKKARVLIDTGSAGLITEAVIGAIMKAGVISPEVDEGLNVLR